MNVSKRYLGSWEKLPVVKALTVVIALAGIALGADMAWSAWQNNDATPSCSWPVQVRGTATNQQVGLVRCYLQALAARDTTKLMAVAANTPPVHITKADLGYSADARAGLATATFTPSPVDSSFVLLAIVYANGVREDTGIINMISMGQSSDWRMRIGSPISNSGPPPAGAT